MRYIDITGQKFNKLTAIEPYGKNENNRKLWKFACDCGGVKITAYHYVKSGTTTSCGCENVLRIQRLVDLQKSRTKPDNLMAKNKLFGRYKNQAYKRGISFDLLKIEFLELIKSNCYYCNSLPNTVLYPKHKNKDSFLIYTGIDRINNNLGYSRENCVPCCGLCNRMKSDMPVTDFIKHLKEIVQNYGSHV